MRLSEDEEVCFFSIRTGDFAIFVLKGIFQGIVECIFFEFKRVVIGSDRSPACLLVLFFLISPQMSVLFTDVHSVCLDLILYACD